MSESTIAATSSAEVEQIRSQRLSTPIKAVFGMGDWLNTMTYGMMGAFLMYFYSDVIVIPLGVVTTVMSLSKLWDAINDPVIGIIIDKTRSRWGVYRPWLLFSSIPFAIIAILCFAPTGNWGSSASTTWFVVIYMLYMVVFTMYHIAYGALGSAMTQNPDDRGSLFGYRLGSSQAMYWVLSSTFLPLVGLISSRMGMETQWAYFISACIFTLPGIIFAAVIFAKCKEVVPPPKSTKMPFKSMVNVVAKNPPLLMAMAGQFVCGIYQTGRSTVMMYYFTYFVENMAMFSIYNLIGVGCGILGPFTAPYLQAKFGNKGRVVALGGIVAGLCFSLMFWVNPMNNVGLFLVLAGIGGYFQGLISASVYACMLDTVEYGQWKTGVRASGFIVSLCHFANKVGMTIVTAGAGGLLAALGYVANQSQNPQVLSAINIIFTIGSGVIGIALGIMFLFYKLDRDTYYDILEKLKLREREEEAAEMAAK